MINKMKKLTLAAAKSDIDRIAGELLWLSSVEINPAELCDGVTVYDASADIAEHERRVNLLSEAIETLAVYGSGKKSKRQKNSSAAFSRKDFEKLDSTVEEALKSAETLREITRSNSALKSEINRKESEIINISPWERLDIPLSLEATASAKIIKGTLPCGTVLSEVCDNLSGSAIIGEVNRDNAYIYMYAICFGNDEETVRSVLSRFGFSSVNLRNYESTCSEELGRLRSEISALNEECAANLEKIKQLAAERRKLEHAYDYICAKLEKLKVKSEILCTESVCILQGWIPKEAIPRLSDKLAPFECYYELSDPETGEDVPVMLSNTRFASPFESIIAMYAYPQYGTFDPTLIMGIFYALIFGMIMQDVGYGLLLAIGCPLMIKLMRPKESTKKMLKAFSMCGISTIIFGVLFGGYFSDFPHQLAVNFFGASEDALSDIALLFNPVENNMGFLVMTLAVGALHMVIGMLIKAYMLIRDGDVFAAIFDVGSWLVLFAGIGVWVAVPSAGPWVAVLGALMLILTQGRDSKSIIGKFFKGIYSLYNIISYLSDLLSYSRIFALGLSGAIIGQVMNILGTLGGNSIVGFIALILIFIVGHVLNLALSLISAFVHTARLQYIEFFGKFYVDGGRPFNPAKINTKYSEITEEAKQS